MDPANALKKGFDAEGTHANSSASRYPSYILSHLTYRSKKSRNSDSIFFINKWEYQSLLKLFRMMNKKITALETLASVSKLSNEKLQRLVHLIRRIDSVKMPKPNGLSIWTRDGEERLTDEKHG